MTRNDWAQNSPLAQTRFFLKNQQHSFDLLLGPFRYTQSKNILRVDADLHRCVILRPKMTQST